MKTVTLVVGLGNPGKKYEKTRHNIGFMVIDKIVADLGLSNPQKNKSYELWMWDRPNSEDSEDKVLFVKPLTFMNNSGPAVAELVRFFKVGDENILVIQDDLDLEDGLVRHRIGGGNGGHNGIASIQQQLPLTEFKRIKVGIGRPPADMPADAYVLQPWPSHPELIANVADFVVSYVSGQAEFKPDTTK